jgi:hypothetical protein
MLLSYGSRRVPAVCTPAAAVALARTNRGAMGMYEEMEDLEIQRRAGGTY